MLEDEREKKYNMTKIVPRLDSGFGAPRNKIMGSLYKAKAEEDHELSVSRQEVCCFLLPSWSFLSASPPDYPISASDC